MKIADNPTCFTTSPAVQSSVREMIEIAKTRKLIWREIRVVLTYLAAKIIFSNGQRPGVVQQMTIDEWEAKTEENGQFIIDVMEHKIAAAFGAASVVVAPEVVSLMEEYFLYIRQKITPQNATYEKRFFLTNTGNEFRKIIERMREVAESFGLSVPTVGLQRKVIATEAFKSEDNIVVRNIQRHMCHSAATCEKFYQHKEQCICHRCKKCH